MRKLFSLILLLATVSTVLAQSLTLYVGRGEALAGPIIERFEAETRIDVQVRYGSTAELAVLITEEGAASPADIFWAQDAGALGALANTGLLVTLPESLVANVQPKQIHPSMEWVAVSARNRVLAYSSERVSADELPASIFDLTDARFAGRVAWAPGNASFQSFVTALRTTHGEEAAEQWLRDMIVNGAVAYRNNGTQLDGIASGEVDFGLVNNYYLPRRLAEDPNFPVAQTFFGEGDIGNLANGAGQTPGKRAMGLRVLQEGGVRVGFEQVLLRNLARAVDGLPVLYAVGGVSALLTARHQRLGDLLAGTVVVRERRLKAPEAVRTPADAASAPEPLLPQRVSRLPQEERALVLDAVRRCDGLDLEARLKLFAPLSERLESSMALARPPHLSAENWCRWIAAALVRPAQAAPRSVS